MLHVRPYRTGDAETIVTWLQTEEAFYKWSAGILGEFPLTAERFQEANAGMMDSDSFFPFTAFDENGIVGYFFLKHREESRDYFRIGFVVLDPEVRGKGYGKEMLRLALKFVFEVYGVGKATLGVFENNPAAYHCYKAVGFKESGETEYYSLLGEEWKDIEMYMEKER